MVNDVRERIIVRRLVRDRYNMFYVYRWRNVTSVMLLWWLLATMVYLLGSIAIFVIVKFVIRGTNSEYWIPMSVISCLYFLSHVLLLMFCVFDMFCLGKKIRSTSSVERLLSSVRDRGGRLR